VTPATAERTLRERSSRRGYVHVYTGEGKGKTTAAMGLALRAAGHGRRVYIGQFMKGRVIGEVKALEGFECVEVEQFGAAGRSPVGHGEGTHAQRAHDGLARARDVLRGGDHDLVILDEIDVAVACGLLTTGDCLALLDLRPRHVELVLTGRAAPRAIQDRADLVTEIREVKHYYRGGAAARAGIEY
jgi:cob(I)alamin adenosyltransferase